MVLIISGYQKTSVSFLYFSHLQETTTWHLASSFFLNTKVFGRFFVVSHQGKFRFRPCLVPRKKTLHINHINIFTHT